MGVYDHLSKEELISLLEKRQAERKLGLVWERSEIEHDNHQRQSELFHHGP